MFEIVASVLLTAIVAIAAWFVTLFLANPILKFYHLREDTHAALFYTANVGSSEPDTARYNEATAELRRLATRLDALGHTAKFAAIIWFKRRSYDLHKAAQGLTGLSNSLDRADGSNAIHRTEIEKALKLPQFYTDESIKKIKMRLDRNAR